VHFFPTSQALQIGSDLDSWSVEFLFLFLAQIEGTFNCRGNKVQGEPQGPPDRPDQSVEFSKLLHWEISQSHFSFLLPNGADAGADAGLCQCGCRVA
jgi:hypothetical protein